MRLLSCMVLLLAICVASADAQAEMAESDLYVLTLLPYFNPEFTLELQYLFDLGNTIYPAIELAAEMINNRTDILNGFNIKLLKENSACTIPFRATEGLLRGLSVGKDDPPIVGIIGPACSISSTSVAEFCGQEEVSLLNIYFVGTPTINDRKRYPFSYGSIDSVDVIPKAVVALIKQQSWTSISVFYAESRLYFTSLAQLLNKEILTYNSNVEMDKRVTLQQRGIRENNPSPVASIQNKNRIAVFMVDGQLLLQMLCLLHHLGLEFPNYMFILAGTLLTQPTDVEVTYKSKTLSCFSNTIEKILSTSVLIDYQLETADEQDIKFSGISLETFKMLYEERVQDFNEENNVTLPALLDAAIFFDSLWSLSLALNNSMDKVNLSTYSFLGQQNNTKIIRKELDKLDYEGISGRIQFNDGTGRVKQNITITLIGGGELGYYTSASNNISVVAVEAFNNSFIDVVFKTKTLLIPEFLFYIVVIFAVLSLAVVVTLHITTFIFRNRQSVKAASIRMTQVAYASSYAFIVASLLNVVIQGGFLGAIEPDAACILHHALDLLVSLSLTLLFGITCLRTWRLYRIFVHFKNPGKFLSDNYLLSAMGILVLLNLVLSVPPIFFYRYRAASLDVTSATNVEALLSRIMICERRNYFLWFFFDLSVTGFLMVVLLVLTIQTRKIAQRNFKTKVLIWMLYLLSLVLPVLVCLYLLFSIELTYSSMIARFVVFSILMEFLIVITIVMVFLPPLLPVLVGTRRLMRWEASASARRSSLLSTHLLFSFNF